MVARGAITLVSLGFLAACATAGAGAGRLTGEDPAVAAAVDARTGLPAQLQRTLASHDATILVWWATACPCVRRYHARIEALAAEWGPRGVAVVAVSSNVDDTVERLRAAAVERGLSLPVVIDPGGALARALGVVSTPSAVVLDRQGAARFVGWIDNERRPGEAGRVAWVDDAVEAVLAGRAPSVERSPVWGCTITRSLGGDGRCAAPPKRDEP